MSHKHSVTITGVPAPSGLHDTPPVRREINDVIKDKKQFSLLVQAMRAMMDEKQDDTLSWFSIGGIHGLPYEAWDNATGTQNAGYCTHGSNLFPTWHRPYVALIEQTLQARAVQIAKKYTTESDEWVKAAQTLRFPYWDWAAHTIPPDEVIRMHEINVETPAGPQKIDNPLYAYRFHPIDSSFQGQFARDPTTVRNPQPRQPTVSNPDALVESLQSYDARSEVFKTMTLIDDWFKFSNHTYEPQQGAVANSLEQIHDIMHGLVGGGGHMGDLGYAGFDPIFWLHHANVDRLTAIWQTLHPNVWVAPEREPQVQTFTIPPNSIINADTALTPFWNGPDSFWESKDGPIRNWNLLNYEYPEFAKLSKVSANQRRAAILKVVRELYGPAGADESKPAPGQGGQDQETGVLDWFVRVRAGRFALGTSYTILLFFGEPPASPSEWRTSPEFVGYHVVLISSTAERCPNCEIQRNNIDEGFVHITDRLRSLGLLNESEDQIEEYLRKNLHWRIQKIDASVVDPSEVANLELSVMTVPLKWSSDDEVHQLPIDARPTHRNVTHGRVGGRSSA